MGRVVCSECGYANSQHRVTCKKCHASLELQQQVMISVAEAGGGNEPTPYRYLIEPFLGGMKRGENIKIVGDQLQKAISHWASYGWEYYRMEKINVELSPGCLLGLLGVPPTITTYDFLVFRMPNDEENNPE